MNNYSKQFLRLGDLLFLKYQDSRIKIKDHFQLIRGKTPSTNNSHYYQNGTIRWINSGILTNLHFLTKYTPISKLISKKAVVENNLNYCQANSVLITRIQFNLDKIVWCQVNDIAIGDSVWNLVSEEELKNSTLFFALRWWIKQSLFSYSHGTVIQMLRSTEIMNLQIPWITNDDQQNKLLTM